MSLSELVDVKKPEPKITLNPFAWQALRLICPECKKVWETFEIPAECWYCRAIITIKTVKKGVGNMREHV